MEQFMWLLSGAFMMALINWSFGKWKQVSDIERRKSAESILKRNGLSAELYLATIGIEDRELRNSMDYFAFRGFLIMDRKDEIVGRLCPRVKAGPHLRLVVSNDGPIEE